MADREVDLIREILKSDQGKNIFILAMTGRIEGDEPLFQQISDVKYEEFEKNVFGSLIATSVCQ